MDNQNRRFSKYSEWLQNQRPVRKNNKNIPMPPSEDVYNLIMSAPVGKVIDLKYIREVVEKMNNEQPEGNSAS